MALATFPPTILNPNQGTLVIQVYLNKKLIEGQHNILSFSNHLLYSIGNSLQFKEIDDTYGIGALSSGLINKELSLEKGYNTIYLTWEESNLKIFLHNKSGLNSFQMKLKLTLNQPADYTVEVNPDEIGWTGEEIKKTINIEEFSQKVLKGLFTNDDYVISSDEFHYMIQSKQGALAFNEDFGGTYIFLHTSETTIFYENFNDLEELVTLYNRRYLGDIINQSLLIENPHPFRPLLPLENDVFYRDFRDSEVRYAVKPFLEATPAPLDSSPILVEDTEGFLYRQYFFNHETGEYHNTNTETFILTEMGAFNLSYDNIDPDFPLLIFVEGEQLDNYQLDGNTVYIFIEPWQYDLFYGKELKITYKLNRAYFIEYNEDSAHYSYKMKMTDEDTRPVSITQEGNSASPVRLATELELNPMLNPQHTGFIYIDKEEQHVHDFRLNVSSSYLLMDGMDTSDFIVEAIDQYGNEVLSPHLSVFITDKYNSVQTTYGQLVPIINEDTLKARNTAGRLYFKYHAPRHREGGFYKDEIFLNVYDRKSQLGTQIPLRLRAPLLTIAQSVNKSENISSYASVPFEYFARYYERTIPANHPIQQLDYDNDGYLSREDWLEFRKEFGNHTFMQTLTQELLEQEEL